jgi:hypothetical protein
MSKRPPRHSLGNYTVGKGRPPTATRWKPGQSGNPKGRPKGTRNAATMAKAELARKIIVNLNGVKRKMSVAQIAFRRLGDKSTGGDIKAFNYLLTLQDNVAPADVDTAGGTTSEQDKQIIENYYKRSHGKGMRDE